MWSSVRVKMFSAIILMRFNDNHGLQLLQRMISSCGALEFSRNAARYVILRTIYVTIIPKERNTHSIEKETKPKSYLF